MKRVWIAVGILLGIFSVALLHSWYLSQITNDIAQLLERAEQKVESSDWDGAVKLSRIARQKWEGHDVYFHILLRHAEADEVYTTLGEVEELLQCRKEGEYSAANARLITKLGLLAEAEQLTIENIL